MTRTETVTSSLLNEPPAEVEKPARAVDPDFEASVKDGYVETPDAWMARIAAQRAQTALVNASGDDVETSRADLRAAACLARGVSLADICPSMGYDLSARAFTAARDSWAEHLQAHRPSEWTYARHDKARAFWAKARPDLIADWPEVER
ncbi:MULTISPECIES: hypothetical protein [unclassified Streptomyces]|uniref:hypothetical protein n=1 Tax=unclassified Streptomyces TaxID=2593676 RepID=UPI00332FC6A2